MKKNIIFVLFTALVLAGCGNQSKPAAQEHDHEAESGAHVHGDVKLQITAYTDDFELFAEADPFVTGEASNILAHFTHLPEFEALEEGKVRASLVVEGNTTSQILHKATRRGIFSFTIKPENTGTGQLIFDIETAAGAYQMIIPNVVVYEDHHDAIHEADEEMIHSDDGIAFTKEQSWKIDFATEEAKDEPFGQVIKTSARIEPSQDDQQIIIARTAGIVILHDDYLLEGQEVSGGEALLTISGNNMAENNIEVQYREARNNYERTKADFERLSELSAEQIVSEKERLDAENAYKNASARYETLKRSFTTSGQKITSPVSGYIKHMHISNGQYVEAGEALVSIAQNKSLLLTADVQQKYASVMDKIHDATIRSINNDRTYTLKELDGKVISYGKSTNDDNYLLPVHLQVNNAGRFVPGSFVEVYLIAQSSENTVTIPTSALLEDQDNFSVYVQLTPELFELRNVQTGETDGIRTEITQGVKAGERVVSRGGVLMKLAQVTGTLDAHSGHVH